MLYKMYAVQDPVQDADHLIITFGFFKEVDNFLRERLTHPDYAMDPSRHAQVKTALGYSWSYLNMSHLKPLNYLV